MGLAERTLFWLLVCSGSFGLGFLTSVTVAGQAEDRGVAPLIALGLGGVAAGGPVSILVGALITLFSGNPFLPVVRDVLPYVCVIAVIVGALYEVLEARLPAESSGDTPDQPDPGWISKLPSSIGRDLVCLQAQDHYVLAQTVSGQALVRSSLSEAERGLTGLGMRVHRSWWVAHDHVQCSVYSGGSPKIVLSSGEMVPVGRAYRRAVRGFMRARTR